MKAKTFRLICFPIVAVILAIVIALNVIYFGTPWGELANSYLFSTQSLDSATREEGEALATQIEEEGIVMVKNDDDCLPLDKSVTKVNVFGWSSTQWIMGGSGSGRSVQQQDNLHPATDLLGALTDYGIVYNTELTNMYTKYLGTRPFWDGANTGGALHYSDYEFCRLYEPDIQNDYTVDLKNNAVAYSNVALVVLGRASGESVDAPLVQYKGTSNSSVPDDTTRTYLDVSTEEEALLKWVGENFSDVVVIINSTNTMNLGFLDYIDGLDSCLIVGGTGNNAANAIPRILFGDTSPSGKTVDTYVYDFSTAATYVNSGIDGVGHYTGTTNEYPIGETNGNIDNSSQSNKKFTDVSYLDYAEGIYVGYKWYETADAEGFWNSQAALDHWGVESYEDVVQYPFGYGLSYTEFSWDVVDVAPKANATLSADDTISVTVRVTNVGDIAAQEVVELYFSAPYTNGIEKSSINLAAFAKTPTAVEPGESQELTLSFEVSDMASYDSEEIYIPGGGYILEQGTYTVQLMTDAHNVAEVGLGKSIINYEVKSDITYLTDPVSGNIVHNLFTGDNISDGIAIDGSDTGENITYLTRIDFEGTFPFAKTAERSMDQQLKDTNLFTKTDVEDWLNENATDLPLTGAKNGIMLYDSDGNVTEVGLEYGNPDNYYNEEMWDSLLDQLTITEMRKLVLHGYTHEEAIASVGKPKTLSVDGPAQIGSFNQVVMGVGYPNPTVLAQSWNTNLSKSYGLAVGKEAAGIGYDGWYAPGINIHRSAFGGRNYEYYSEDSYLSGVLCAAVVQGAADAGTYTYIKHIIGYDQESYRDGLYCWMTEQALREVYLKPFKIAIDEGGAMGLMTSYGRIGAVWSGGSKALLTDLLRTEWGFKGMILSDYADHHNYMNCDQMLLAGGDLWMDFWNNSGTFNFLENSSYNSDGAFVTQLRSASKHVIYAILNASYVNSQYNASDDSVAIVKSSVDKFNWIIPTIIAIDVVAVLGCGVWVFFAIRKKDKPTEIV